MGAVRSRVPRATSASRDPQSVGSRAAHSWLAERGLGGGAIKRWHAEISLAIIEGPAPAHFDERIDTRFHVDIYAEEWGFFFCHGGHTSWIRVTDIPFVHGRDEFGLLAQAPALADIGALVRGIENQHDVSFRRMHALIRTNVAGAEPAIRRWVEHF